MQSHCSTSKCKNFVSAKASVHGRTECKVCRRENGSLISRCQFVYQNGTKCNQRNHEYHYHCSGKDCNGALFCELCMQCPNCEPCH